MLRDHLRQREGRETPESQQRQRLPGRSHPHQGEPPHPGGADDSPERGELLDPAPFEIEVVRQGEGAQANVKLWQALNRRMNEESTEELSARVN